MDKLKFIFTLCICKAMQFAMRLFGKNATFLPGKLALKLYPNFLSKVKKPPKIIVITGTNGKTTTTNFIADALTFHNEKVLSNPFGSNTAAGIASTLLNGSFRTRGAKYEIGVFEMDERSAMHILPFIKPDLLVVTNLFRDSVVRNAHALYIADILSNNMPESTKLLLNADDLITCSIAPENPRKYFGISRMDSDVTQCINLVNDYQICPKCNTVLDFEYRRYHHIGKAHCSKCSFASPQYDYTGTPCLSSKTMEISTPTDTVSISLPGDSIFNIYNVLTAFATVCEIGLSPKAAAKALNSVSVPESRYNETIVGDIKVVMQLTKTLNALPCTRAIEYITSKPGEKELILMLSNHAAAKNWSENPSWLYDCDFEFLNRDNITRIITAGARALDYTLRAEFAGVEKNKIRTCINEHDSVDELMLVPGTTVYILFGGDSDAGDIAFRVRDAVKAEILKKSNQR